MSAFRSGVKILGQVSRNQGRGLLQVRSYSDDRHSACNRCLQDDWPSTKSERAETPSPQPRTSRSLLSLFRRETSLSPQPNQQNVCTAQKEDPGSSSWFSFLRRKEKRPKPPLETCRLEQSRRKKQGLEPLEWQPDVELVTQQTETKCKTTERQPKGPPQPKTPKVVEIQMKGREEQKLQSPRGSNTNQTSGSSHAQYAQSEHQKVSKQAFHNAPIFDKNIQPQNLLPFGPHNHQSKFIFKDIHGAVKDLQQRHKISDIAEQKLLSPSPSPSPSPSQVNIQESKPKSRPYRRKTVIKDKQTKKEIKPLHVVSEKISSKDKASFVSYSDTIEPKVAICKARKVNSESVAHSKVPYHVLAREPPSPNKKLKVVSSKNEMQLTEKSFYVGTSERASNNQVPKAADLYGRVMKGTLYEDVLYEKKPSKITQQVPKLLSSENRLKPCIEWAKDPPKKQTRDIGKKTSEKSPYKIPHVQDSPLPPPPLPSTADCSTSHSTKSPGTMFFIDQKRLGKPNTFKTKLGVRSASIDCKKAPPPTGRFADDVKGEVSKPSSKSETVEPKPKSIVNRSNTIIAKNLTSQKIDQFNIKPSYAEFKRAQLLKRSSSVNNLVKFDVMKSEPFKSSTSKPKESNDPKTTNKMGGKEMKLWLNEVCRKEEFLRIKESKNQILGQESNTKKIELKQTVTQKNTINAAGKPQKNTSLSDEGKSPSKASRSITFPAAMKQVQEYTHKTALQGIPVNELKYNMDISKIPKYLSTEPHKTSSSNYMRHQSRASSTGFKYPPKEKASVKNVNNDDKNSTSSKTKSKIYEPSPKAIDSSKSEVGKNLKMDTGFPEKTRTPETRNSNKVPEPMYKLGNSSLSEIVPAHTSRTLEPVYDKKLRDKPELRIQNLQRDLSFMKNQQKSLESLVHNKENICGMDNSQIVNELSCKSCTNVSCLKPSPATEELACDQIKNTTSVSKQSVQKDCEQQKPEATKAQFKSAFQPEQSPVPASENVSEQSQAYKSKHQNESPDLIEEHGSKSTIKINQKLQEVASGKTGKFASISEPSKHSCPGELYKVPCALLHKSMHKLCVQECEKNNLIIPEHKHDTESLKDEVDSGDLKLITDVENFYPIREKKPAPSISSESSPVEPSINSESDGNQKNSESCFNIKTENISSLKVNENSDPVKEENLNKSSVLNGEINNEKDLQTESIHLTEKQTNENNTEQYSVEMKSSYYVNDGAPCSLAEMYIHSEMSNVYYKQEEPPLPTGVNPIAQGTVLQDIGNFGQKQLMRSYSDYRGPNTGTIFIECKDEKNEECKQVPFNKIKRKKSYDGECIQISLPGCKKTKTTVCTAQTNNFGECKQKPLPMPCYAECIKDEPQEQGLTECYLLQPQTCDTTKKRIFYDGCNPPDMTKRIICSTKPTEESAEKIGKSKKEPALEVILSLKKPKTANVGESTKNARLLNHGLSSSSIKCSSSTMLINQLNKRVYFPKRYYSQINIDGFSSAHAMECQSNKKGEPKKEKDKCKKLPFAEGTQQKAAAECERISLPGCNKPKSTICEPKKLQVSDCTRIPPPRPSYTECAKEEPPERKLTECNLARAPSCDNLKIKDSYDGCNPPDMNKPICPVKKSEKKPETDDKGKSKPAAKKSAHTLGNDISYKLMQKISGVYLMNQMTQKYSFPRRFYSSGSKGGSKGKADKCKKMPFEITKSKKSQTECLKISLPGCFKPKSTICETKDKKLGECKRIPPPLPCYAECLKDPRPEQKHTECNLKRDPTCDAQAKRMSYDGCNPPDTSKKVTCPNKKGEEKSGSKSPEKSQTNPKED